MQAGLGLKARSGGRPPFFDRQSFIRCGLLEPPSPSAHLATRCSPGARPPALTALLLASHVRDRRRDTGSSLHRSPASAFPSLVRLGPCRRFPGSPR